MSRPTIGYGLSIAVKRLPQILAWALLSATIGVVLRLIENAHEKVGAIVTAVLGTAWTVLTYFVVPVLAVEGVGPVEALKRSVGTLKGTWGEALLGNFSLGVINLLLTLPLVLLFVLMLVFGVMDGNTMLTAIGLVGLVLTLILSAIVSAASDVVFRALLYNYATGRTIPDEVDDAMLGAAFGAKS